jgi:retron-type reverse transcriptase
MGKKYKNIYNNICTFENIWYSSRKARMGKRMKNQTLDFEFNLENNLFVIQDQLINENYKFGSYNEFCIYEPKERIISAAPYRDRVVHHALCNVIEPVLDKAMIYDSYACRRSKGTHLAVKRAQHFLRSSKWVLKLDLKKYFFTIDHEILIEELKQKISDNKVINLIRSILATYQSPDEFYYYFDNDNLFDCIRKRGLPIGNLTSQLFANFYLNKFDRFIKEELKHSKYIRYMDDALIFADSKSILINTFKAIEKFLNKFRLKLHEKKCQMFPVKNGVNFLGFHLYDYHKRVLRQNLKRFKSRMRRFRYQLDKKYKNLDSLYLSLNSWLGYVDKNLYNKLLNDILEPIKFRNKDNVKFSFIIV